MTTHSPVARGMLSGEHNVKNCHYILHIHRKDCAAISRHACEHTVTVLSVILQEDCGGHPKRLCKCTHTIDKRCQARTTRETVSIDLSAGIEATNNIQLCLAELEALLLNHSQLCHSVCRQV